jgi:hypothetical protein
MLSKHDDYGEEGQALFKKPTWSRILVLFGYGGMIVTVLFLLSGCGSDSKPGAVSGKKGKTAVAPDDMKSSGAAVLGNRGELSGGGTIKRELNAVDKLGMLPGSGLSPKELEERLAADVKRSESPNYEVVPGMTRQQMEAKIAAAQQEAQKKLESPNYEVVPGMTRQQIEAKIAAAQQEAQKKLESQNYEVFPGMTSAEMKHKVEAAKKAYSQRQEVSPGITKDELNGRIDAARRNSE